MPKPYALNASKFLSPHELMQLEGVLERYRNKEPRNVLMIELALNTGPRATELLRIRRQDVHPETKSVFIRGIKGSNDREIPLSDRLFKDLDNYLATLSQIEPKQRIFGISYERLKQIWYNYRPAPKGLHCLRHTFAIRLYQKTKDLRLVKVALGHRSITNTMIYAEYEYSVAELRKLIF